MPRGVVQEVEAVEEKPVAGVLMGLNGLAYLLLLTALAAGIAWIVYVAKAKNQDAIGNDQPIATADVCFQGAVVAILLYFVARHHFSHLRY